jgi:hypothetical protein
MEVAQWNETVSQLKGASTKEMTSAIVEAMQGKTGDEKQKIAKQVADEANGIGGPDPETRNKLWRIVISAFAIVLVGGFIALALGVFLPIQEKGVKPELILTTFTSVVGFLAGLFTPSPVAGATNGKAE